MPLRFVAAVVALAVAASGIASRPALARRHADDTGLPGIRLARPAPDFAFATPAGPRTLATLLGRPVVLNFWATWCEPCQAEVSAFAELGKAYGDTVPFLAVSEDETPGVAATYLAAHGVSAVSIDDPERKIFARYTVVPIPTTIVIAPDGTVAHVSVGELDWRELETAVDAVRPATLTGPHRFDTVGRNAGTQGQ